jgi:hypothetical protein
VIIPKNDKKLVKELCDLIDISPYQWFTVTGERVPFQLPARVGQVFEEELDLATNKENLVVRIANKHILYCSIMCAHIS